MTPPPPSSLALALIGAATTAVFLVDLTTPLGLGVPFLYLLPALIAIGTRQSDRVLLVLAVLCPALAALKLLAPPTDGVLEYGQGNRLMFALLMWALVGLELLRRRYEARIREERRKFSLDLERLVQERTEALHRANAELLGEVAERRRVEKTIQDYAERVHGLAERLVEIQEIERTGLAAELHDRIGQNLTALNINLNLNLAQLPADTAPAIKARIRDSLSLVEQTTEVVRGVMEELRPALLDQYGLATALRWYGEEFAGRTGIRVDDETQEPFPRLRHKVEITLFRIVQEALTNIAKHARAGRVTVALARTPAGIELRVSDDGVGMEAKAVASRPVGSGWGLSIMAERARSIGAQLRIDTHPGQGTGIVLALENGLWENGHDHHRTDR